VRGDAGTVRRTRDARVVAADPTAAAVARRVAVANDASATDTDVIRAVAVQARFVVGARTASARGRVADLPVGAIRGHRAASRSAGATDAARAGVAAGTRVAARSGVAARD